MDSVVKTDYKTTSVFLNADQISTVFKILETNILTNKKLSDNGIFTNAFLLILNDHNKNHKVDIKQSLEEKKFNFRIDENNTFNIIGYPRGNFIFLFTHNFLICLKAKLFVFKFFTMPIFKDLTSEYLLHFNKVAENKSKEIDLFFDILDKEKDNLSNEKVISKIEEILIDFLLAMENKAERFFLALLGIRTTAGSVSDLPPIESILKATFCDLHSKVRNYLCLIN